MKKENKEFYKMFLVKAAVTLQVPVIILVIVFAAVYFLDKGVL